MPPNSTIAVSPNKLSWAAAAAELDDAVKHLAVAPPGIVSQRAYNRWNESRNQCTALLHSWLAEALGMEPVNNPRMVFSLDVDGVLEDEGGGFSCTGARGAAALRLLQLGGVAVLLNTARSLEDVKERVSSFHLLGGVSGFGSITWDGVFCQADILTSATANAQLRELRSVLRSDPRIVQDRRYQETIRASQVSSGEATPISGGVARAILDRNGLDQLTFWVAPNHTDFVDRSVDKGRGLSRLVEQLGLARLPVAAMGDAGCDVPMLRRATQAFVPAATLPSYIPPRRQNLVRCRSLGENALWTAACQLVPDTALQRQVTSKVAGLAYPDWFPTHVSKEIRQQGRALPRLATALVARLTSKESNP